MPLKNEKLNKLLKHQTITSALKRKLEIKKGVYREKLGIIEQVLSKKVEDVQRTGKQAGEGTV